MARQGLIARRVHGDPARTLLLRDITGGIGGGEQFLERAALARDLDQPDGHPDVEDLVFPDETVVPDRAADIIGDLAGLLERTADQQHAELIAPEAADGVAVAHRIAQQLGDFAQHAVAGDVPARVVHDLEAVEVEITQHVLPIAAMAPVDRLLGPPFELAAVDHAGERIVRRLIGHLASQAPQLRHVVQQHDRPYHLVRLVAHRRGGQLDRALAAVRTRQQQRAPAECDRSAARQRLPHRIGQQPSIRLVDETDDLFERLAQHLLSNTARELLRGRIHVSDAPLGIRGDDRLGERVERHQLQRRLALHPQSRHRLRRDDLHARDQQRLIALVTGQGRGDLEPAHLPLQPDHVDLVALRRRLARETRANVVAHQLGVLGRHEIAEPAPDELDALDTYQAGELPVGIQDHVAMDQHRLMNALAEIGEQLGGRAVASALRGCGGARLQLIDRGDERRDLRLVTVHVDASSQVAADRDALQLLEQLFDAPPFATLEPIQHKEESRDEREHEAQQPDNRH